MLEEALKALAAAGPVALLAGIIVIVLWRKLGAVRAECNRLRAHYEGDPDDTTGTKVGLIAQIRQAAQKREDNLRTNYETRLDHERVEQRKVMDELLDTLRDVGDG